MAAPDTALIKSWCRIDGDEFDTILSVMIASATSLASHETGVDYTVEAMPESVQIWVAANISYWINSPDAASEKRADPSPFIAGLLDPHRTFNWTPPVV